MNSQSRPLLPLGGTSINNGAHQEESALKACFKRVTMFAYASIGMVSVLLIAAFTAYKDIKLPTHSLTSAVAVLFLTFFCALILWTYSFVMSDCIVRVTSNWQYMLHVLVVSLNGVSIMFTHAFLLGLVNHVHVFLACFLVVVPVSIGKLAYARNQINGTDQLSRDQAFELALKSCSDVAYMTIICAFPMYQAILFGYYKNPSLRLNQLPSLDLSVTFLASVLGYYSAMVTAMPLELFSLAERSNLHRRVKVLKASMIILTEAAAMTMGLKFLDGFIVLALVPTLVVIVAHEAFTEERVGPDLINFNEEPEIPPVLIGVMVICIFLLSAVNGLYQGDKNGDVYLKGSILVLIAIITSSLSWIAFLLMPSKNKQRAKMTNLVSGILLLLEIITAAALLIKIFIDLYN